MNKYGHDSLSTYYVLDATLFPDFHFNESSSLPDEITANIILYLSQARKLKPVHWSKAGQLWWRHKPKLVCLGLPFCLHAEPSCLQMWFWEASLEGTGNPGSFLMFDESL